MFNFEIECINNKVMFCKKIQRNKTKLIHQMINNHLNINSQVEY